MTPRKPASDRLLADAHNAAKIRRRRVRRRRQSEVDLHSAHHEYEQADPESEPDGDDELPERE
jgi:hypothetical protein